MLISMQEKVDGKEPEYAGFWIRFAAAFIDGISVSIAGFVITLGAMMLLENEASIAAMEAAGPEAAADPFYGWLYFLISAGYYIGFTGSVMQGTPGKKAVGIRVMTSDFQDITYLRAAGRYLGYILSYITVMIGFMMAGWNRRKRALHDMAAGTIVVYR